MLAVYASSSSNDVVSITAQHLTYLNCPSLVALLVFGRRKTMQLFWWTLMDGESGR